MFCHYCGKKNVDDAKFCSYCGTELKSSATAAASGVKKNGNVSIKMNVPAYGTINIFEMSEKKILWSGKYRDIANFSIDGKTRIGITWGLGFFSKHVWKSHTFDIEPDQDYSFEIVGASRGYYYSLVRVNP